MTQKEIHEFLANTKMYVAGKSKEIQEKLFSLGYAWNDGKTEVKYTRDPFLFINEEKIITRSSNMEYFTNKNHREISDEEILSLELTGPTHRLFKNKEECWAEMQKHQPFGWVKTMHHSYCLITYVMKYMLNGEDSIEIDFTRYSLKEAFEQFTFADGTPFGIKEE